MRLIYSKSADQTLTELESNPHRAKVHRAVKKTLGLMEVNLRHPSLNTHKYSSLKGSHGEDIFESYAQNKTPGAYRVFWHYGPSKNEITIVSITPHP